MRLITTSYHHLILSLLRLLCLHFRFLEIIHIPNLFYLGVQRFVGHLETHHSLGYPYRVGSRFGLLRFPDLNLGFSGSWAGRAWQEFKD